MILTVWWESPDILEDDKKGESLREVKKADSSF